jgi:hypothetical protein
MNPSRTGATWTSLDPGLHESLYNRGYTNPSRTGAEPSCSERLSYTNPSRTGAELSCSGRIGCSCSTCVTCVTSHQCEKGAGLWTRQAEHIHEYHRIIITNTASTAYEMLIDGHTWETLFNYNITVQQIKTFKLKINLCNTLKRLL